MHASRTHDVASPRTHTRTPAHSSRLVLFPGLIGLNYFWAYKIGRKVVQTLTGKEGKGDKAE